MTAANILRYLAHAALFALIAAAIWLPARRIWLKRRGAQADLQKGQRNRPHPRPSDRRGFCAQAPAGTDRAHGQQESGASRVNPRKRLPARLFPDGDPRQEALLLALVAYLAALAEIIALRIGLGHAARTLNLIPLETTLAQLRGGTWPLLYHSLGNVGWFVPLGALLAARNPNLRFWAALGIGAGISAAMELTQYLLSTGVTDVDDVWLNALGALAGWALACGGRALRRRMRRT